MDKMYDALGERPLSVLFKLQLGIHRLFCRRCAEEVKNLETIRRIMKTYFSAEPSDIEDRIMERIYKENIDFADMDSEYATGVSFRSWVITGCIILFSLSTVFFGFDFIKIASSNGSSFLLPVGLTIGCIVTGYGAVFIGSHLKELSQWLRLHE
jgi:hypothetical protein